jgi:hypothetical protein
MSEQDEIRAAIAEMDEQSKRDLLEILQALNDATEGKSEGQKQFISDCAVWALQKIGEEPYRSMTPKEWGEALRRESPVYDPEKYGEPS